MKKKNVNKLLALGLVSAMTAGMLAGCGNTASTSVGLFHPFTVFLEDF